VVEHPIRQGWKLVSAQKPVETTAALYRFQGRAVAQKVTIMTVQEERITGESITLRATDPKQLLAYSSNSEIPASVRDAIARAAALSQAINDTKLQIDELNRSIAEITSEQERIRENMKTVAVSTDYYERLLGKLNQQENAIEAAQARRVTLQARLVEENRALDSYLQGLTLG
jgi:chromosome segregation ATPase